MGFESDATIELLREVGFARLAAYDGCVCSSVKIREFEIDVGCRKGSGGYMGAKIWPDFYGTVVRVCSRALAVNNEDCALVAEEVKRQVNNDGGDAQIAVRLCSYEDDDKGRCSYCHEPRTERWGYYCAKHLTPESRDPWNCDSDTRPKDGDAGGSTRE